MKINIFVVHTNQTLEMFIEPDWSIIECIEKTPQFDFVPEIDSFVYYNNVIIDRLATCNVLNITNNDTIVIEYRKIKRRKIKPMIFE